MRVLVACEYSGRVRQAFRDLGHDAWSCDLLPSEDNSPYHIQGDIVPILDQGWDLMVAHPPCTYLAVSGLHWNKKDPARGAKTEEALEFVRLLMNAPIPRIAIENPVSCISTRIRKPEQIVQPNMFGEDASKKTCLWLKNLPKLVPTQIVVGKMYCCGRQVHEGETCPVCQGTKKPKRIYGNQTPSGQNKLGPSPDRWKERSRTYFGVAKAMAEQFSTYIQKQTSTELHKHEQSGKIVTFAS